VLALVSGTEDASYRITHSVTAVEEPLANVVGMIPGRRSDEFVLFSSHYDHLGFERPMFGDSIANGANDNASGTAAVVALAKYFASRGTPERTLLFAAFTAEEAGGFGSRHYSRQLNADQVVAMFNIEMIGKPAAAGPNVAWITGFDQSSFGQILQQGVAGSGFQFVPDPHVGFRLFSRSDNVTLARLGVPAHSISTTPIDTDPDYHKVSDEVETLDQANMLRTIQAIARGAEPIVSGAATPTRLGAAYPSKNAATNSVAGAFASASALPLWTMRPRSSTCTSEPRANTSRASCDTTMAGRLCSARCDAR
jgi:Zn-dependent M28 family amino/carboxypeptidase